MNIGTNTMQIDKVDTSAGSAIWCAPFKIASSTSWPSSRCELMFSIVTVASSTRIPTASASPPSVMILMVSPSAARQAMEARIDSGMETKIMRVLRQLPRNSRIINPVRHAAIVASRTTPEMAPRTKIDWSPMGWIFNSGTAARICGRRSLMALMTSRVELLPFFRTVISAARLPASRAIFVCGGAPSRT